MTSRRPIFPRLVCCTRIDSRYEQSNNEFYDVKFWPYPLPGKQSIFAVAGNREVFVARTVETSAQAAPPFEIVYWWHDIQSETPVRGKAPNVASVNSIAWMKEPESGNPLLAIAGVNPRHIAIIDITKGRIVRELSGHGASVNELVVSPSSPNILASCSEDFTVRLWNLETAYKAQPCVAIIAGQGHRQPLLSCTFHASGRWLLTGSLDTAIALWAVPTSEKLARKNGAPDQPKDEEPLSVLCPHFFSTEVHHNYVDSIACYGDLVLSRSAQGQMEDPEKDDRHNEILLWKIDGFRGDMTVPADVPLAEPGKETRSAFPHDDHSQGFQRLLTFDVHRADRFYLRFGLFHQHELRPMLCTGNVIGGFCFWDLEQLETEVLQPKLSKIKDKKRKIEEEKESSEVSVLEDPFRPIEPHFKVNIKTKLCQETFASFRTAWSLDGHWVIGVGDKSMMVIMHRSDVI